MRDASADTKNAIRQGDFFYNKAAPGIPSHPWVILSDPELEPNDVLIANLTDVDNIHDESCILEPSDHPAGITKKSAVNYQESKVTSVSHLNLAMSHGMIFSKTRVSKATLEKVLVGARDTDELKNAHRILLRRQGFIP